MPSCVVVAQGTLDPLAEVRILARQPSLADNFRLLHANDSPFASSKEFAISIFAMLPKEGAKADDLERGS